MGLSLHHVAVIVTDLGRSADFCQRLFGLRPIERPPFSIPGLWLGVGNPQVRLLDPDRNIEVNGAPRAAPQGPA